MPERPLRVALVSHTGRMGGAEFALVAIAQRLDRRYVDPVAVLAEDGPLAGRLRAVGVEVVVHPLDRTVVDRRKDALNAAGLVHPLVLARAVRGVAGLTRLFRERQIDVVHTNSLKAHFLGGLAGRLAAARVVWHVRDHLSSPYLPSAVVPFVRLAARLVPHRVVAVSRSAAGTIGRRDTIVVHQGVELPDIVRPEPDGRLRVGLVGRIAPWKGQDVFIDAAARLVTEFPEAEFLIVGAPLFGEEDLERELHRRVERHGLGGRVRFLGFQDDVWDVYRRLDVAVHASTQPEPYGNVILEAMASGTALVAAGAGGVVELVEDGATGLLVEPGDPEALASALRRLLRSSEERRRLAGAGRQHVKGRFSPERDAREVEGLWRSLADADRDEVDVAPLWARAVLLYEQRAPNHPGKRALLRLLLRVAARLRPRPFGWRMKNGLLVAISPLEGLSFAWTVGWTCFQTGEWETHVERCIRHVLEPGDVAVDIGANLGYFSAVMAQAVTDRGRVFSFEPVTPTFERLGVTIGLNGFDHVTPLRMALGEADDVAEMSFDARLAGSATLHPGDGSPGAEPHRVHVRRLDDLVADGTVAPPQLIKIDVEGHELAALRGAAGTIRTHRPYIIFEYSESLARRAGWALGDVAELLRGAAGYRFYEITANGLQPLSDLAAVEPGADGYGADLLAAPPASSLG